MNLAADYFVKRSVTILLERYYAGSYRTISDFRSLLLREYKFESVRVREIPGGKYKMDSWELRISGKTYFFNYESRDKTFTYTGVR